LYLKSPLECVAGVTGSNLTRRVRAIMTHRGPEKVNMVKKLALVVAGMAALAVPIGVGIINAASLSAQSPQAKSAAPPKFEVASVRLYNDEGVGPRNYHSTYSPQGVNFGARPVAFLIGEAYGVPLTQIVPAQTTAKGELLKYLREGYDIVAKTDHPVSKAELRLMLQSLLADRFRLTLHRETITRPVYRLVIAKGGPKLEASEDGGEIVMVSGPDGFTFRNAEVFRLAGYLSSFVDRVVVDETGLAGLYNFVVKAPEDIRTSGKPDGTSPDSPSGAMFADVLKPLGLRLVAGMAPVEYLMVDHVERPSGN
jgi:uncharacterized protein (TIGR03435 family)